MITLQTSSTSHQVNYRFNDAAAMCSFFCLSEFVGCSPSLSGAIRVNPWSIDAVSDAMYSALKTSPEHRRLRHDKHWKYVSEHTVAFWAASYVQDLARSTKQHVAMKCYGLGLGLDTFRLVALDANFKKLDDQPLLAAYRSTQRRLLLLDYDGTLIPHRNITAAPGPAVLDILAALTADPANEVWVISGRSQQELGGWFKDVPGVGLAAEHGFFIKPPGRPGWHSRFPLADHSWQAMVMPILKQYCECTDGSHIEVKASALVWHYGDADPDFGNWQAKELLDHLEDVLSNRPIEVISGNTIVEAKPQGVSKGSLVELICKRDPVVTGEVAPHHPGSTSLAAGVVGSGPVWAASPSPAAAAAAGADSHPAAGAATVTSMQDLPPGFGAAAMAARSLGQQRQPATAAAGGGGGGGLASPTAQQQQMQIDQAGSGQLVQSPQDQQQERAAPRDLTGVAVDFVLAVGDDRSDEDMFTAIEQYADTPRHPAEVFACVVGQKPSKAKFYVNDVNEVLDLLAKMGGVTLPPRNSSFTS
eukprot:GHRR01019489.1.p1 GENE.GHRR01019489.1~~GHRR01019489.1.p1  ORF type:complete len:531 (+),score=203.85 GHRR01019489.1:184-1776(+)